MGAPVVAPSSCGVMEAAQRLGRCVRKGVRVRISSGVLGSRAVFITCTVASNTSMRIYTEDVLRLAVENSTSVMGVLRFLGLKQAGGTHALVSKRIKEYGLNTEHFTGSVHNRGKPDSKRKTAADILVVGDPLARRAKRPQLERAMLEVGFTYECAECRLGSEWNGKLLTLEIDHISGEFWDNRAENLRFLCPNCHSQQELTNLPGKYRVEHESQA